MSGDVTNATPSAITAENACADAPKNPRCAEIDSAEASAIAPTPTGLMSYR